MLGLPKKRTNKAKSKKEGSVVGNEGTKSVTSSKSRFGKHKDVSCKVPECKWTGRSDYLKDRHKQQHTKQE
jgi:hypothetical protein